MPAVVTSFFFHEDRFPLSPHVTDYAIRDEFRKVVIVGMTDAAKINDFMVVLNEGERGFVKDAPDATYSILVGKVGPDDKPEITLSLLNDQTNTIHTTLSLDLADFVSAFEAAQDQAPPPLDETANYDNRDFEVAWSVAYLKSKFGHKLEGDDAFWVKLNGDLDMVLIPVNYQMAMAQLPPERRKPLEVIHVRKPF